MNTDTLIDRFQEKQMTETARKPNDHAATDCVREQSAIMYKSFVESVNRAKDSEMDQAMLRQFSR